MNSGEHQVRTAQVQTNRVLSSIPHFYFLCKTINVSESAVQVEHLNNFSCKLAKIVK